jgi:hypothetical protein
MNKLVKGLGTAILATSVLLPFGASISPSGDGNEEAVFFSVSRSF